MCQEIIISLCNSTQDFEIAKLLTKDYMAWLGMDLGFQNVDKEFENFKRMYSAPAGAFIYAKIGGKVVGGVGVRRQMDTICEMKRLFIYENNQGKGLGRVLSKNIISISKELGYEKMRLDTVSKLKSANALYDKLGFKDIPAYYTNPDKTVRYMELELNKLPPNYKAFF